MTTASNVILVVEAHPAVRHALGRVPLGPDMEIEYADLGDALNAEGKFAAVLADDSALTGTGEQLPLTALKERFDCPVILMTLSGNPRIEGYARQAGAASVLFKPFRMGELRRQIWKAVKDDDNIPAPALPSTPTSAATSPTAADFTAADYGAQIAGDKAFDELFTELQRRQPLQEGLDAFDVVERHLIKRALQSCDGNQSQAARFLGITRNTLRKRIRKYGFGNLLAGDDNSDDDEA